MKFEELFQDAKQPATKGGNERLEAQKRKLIADCSFWLRIRDKARREALERTGKTEEELRKKEPGELETLPGSNGQEARSRA